MGNNKYKTGIRKRNYMEFKVRLVVSRISNPMPRELWSTTIFVIRLCTMLCVVYWEHIVEQTVVLFPVVSELQILHSPPLSYP